jgi:hypothetical protein
MSSHAIERPADITVPPTSLWAKMPLIAGVLGLAGTGITVAMMFGEQKERACFAYLFAFLTMLSLALGALIFVLIQHAVRAGWSTVTRRVAETAAATLPLFILLFLPIAFIGLHDLFPWTHETDAILERKAWWFGVFDTTGEHRSLVPFAIRAVLMFGIWTILSVLLYRWSVAQDNLGDDHAKRDALTRKMWVVSAGGIFLYSLSESIAAIDWMMSLQPHWYSTMFGVYFFAGSILGFYAVLTLILMAMQRGGMLKTAVTAEHYHDLGKLSHGHIIFWAYIAFAQFMLIWYANIPEETEFYMARMDGGWAIISLSLPIVHFFFPFFLLLSRHVKRSRTGLAFASLWIFAIHALDIYWNVMPNVGAHAAHNAAADAGEAHGVGAIAAVHTGFGIALVDVAAFVGIAGLCFALFCFLLKRNKVICIGDPRLDESLAHENY